MWIFFIIKKKRINPVTERSDGYFYLKFRFERALTMFGKMYSGNTLASLKQYKNFK